MMPDMDASLHKLPGRESPSHRYVTMSGCASSGQLRSGSSPMRNTTPSRESCFHRMKRIMRITRTSGCPFFLRTWIYTTLGVAGAWRLWITHRTARIDALRWLLLAAFLILPRWISMATLEPTEPRYVVEFSAFLSVLGGIPISCFFGANEISVVDRICRVKDPDMKAINGPFRA